jgi:acyl-CoA thioesterase FadM
MHPIFRFICVLIAAHFSQPIPLLEVSKLRMRVLPNDLDFNLHMNNARYLAISDLGFVDFMLRLGLGKTLLSKGWHPLVGGRLVRHRFGLRAFEPFVVATRLMCWDDKWFYFDQRMDTSRGVAIIVLTKGLIYDRGAARVIGPSELLDPLGLLTQSPEMPPEVRQWVSTEQLLHIPEAIRRGYPEAETRES